MRAASSLLPLAASFLIAMALAARAGTVEEVTVTGHKPSADACQRIAEAKFEQWAQPHFSRLQTETFADGTEKTREKIYTDNTLYIGYGTNWGTLQLFAAQRRVESPEAVAKNMGLHDCVKGENVEEAGQAATIYSYTVGTDDDSGAATVWIADSTGLPLREEMQDDKPKPSRPLKISAVYVYGANVQIPKAAELAEQVRLWRTYDQVINLQKKWSDW